ncbi:MAG: hypothetical protein E7610_01965 [Ruminococcaceae bacterium]|nr:hypothetical protein [Oscillospiraceae bacterium]
MKKRIIYAIVAAMILSVLLLPMTSCSETRKLNRMNEQDRASYFYELINQVADSVESFTMEQTMSMKMDITSVTYEQVTESTLTVIDGKDGLTYLDESKTTIWTGGNRVVLREAQGYLDGMMFLYQKEDDHESKLKSPIDSNGYMEFLGERNESSVEIEAGKGISETMTCMQNADKTWTATYENFTEEGMKPFLKMIDGVEHTVMAEHSLVDVRLTVKADEDFFISTMDIEYIFEKNPDADSRVPEISIKTKYTGWNKTVLAEPYDISDFTEVEDIRVIDRFERALRARKTAEFGSFTMRTDSVVKQSNGSDQNTSTVQKVTYKNVDGFEFTLEYDSEGGRYEYSYKGGSCKVNVKDPSTGNILQSSEAPMGDSEAQMVVQQFMDPEGISTVDIAGYTVLNEEKGSYRFALGAAALGDMEEEFIETYGTAMDKVTGYIDVTVQDGKLMSYVYHVYTEFKIGEVTVQSTVDMSLTFTDLVEGGAAM